MIVNTRKCCSLLSMCCSFVALARYSFHFENVYVPILNNCGINKIIQIVCCWYPKTTKYEHVYSFAPVWKLSQNLRSEKWRKLSVFLRKNRAKVKTYHFFAKKHPKMTKSYCKKSENVNFYALPIVKNTSFYTPFWPFTRKSIKLVLMSEGNFTNRFVHLRGFWKARNCIFEILKISKNVNFPPPF